MTEWQTRCDFQNIRAVAARSRCHQSRHVGARSEVCIVTYLVWFDVKSFGGIPQIYFAMLYIKRDVACFFVWFSPIAIGGRITECTRLSVRLSVLCLPLKATFHYSSQLQTWLQTWFSTRFAARFSTSSCGFATCFQHAFDTLSTFFVEKPGREPTAMKKLDFTPKTL